MAIFARTWIAQLLRLAENELKLLRVCSTVMNVTLEREQ